MTRYEAPSRVYQLCITISRLHVLDRSILHSDTPFLIRIPQYIFSARRHLLPSSKPGGRLSRWSHWAFCKEFRFFFLLVSARRSIRLGFGFSGYRARSAGLLLSLYDLSLFLFYFFPVHLERAHFTHQSAYPPPTIVRAPRQIPQFSRTSLGSAPIPTQAPKGWRLRDLHWHRHCLHPTSFQFGFSSFWAG